MILCVMKKLGFRPGFPSLPGVKTRLPLSPLLYAIQASVLSFQLTEAQQRNVLPGLQMAANVKNINHAQFAYDTLLMGGASIQAARHFNQELTIYKQVSGSKINLQKSKIYGWNCTVIDLGVIARFLGMEMVHDWYSITYLGVPISKGTPKANQWNPILDNFKS